MPEAPNEVNVTRLIDNGPLTGFQIATIVGCALVNLFDGIDTQSIGVAAPFIAEGSASSSPISDRSSRRRWSARQSARLRSVSWRTGSAAGLCCSSPPRSSACSPFSPRWQPRCPMLVAFRVLAGLGLGGATPCIISLTAEYAPARLRATLVTLMWSSFPLGGMIGGLMNTYLLVHVGWRAIFFIGGVVPLVLVVVLFVYLPESIKFLVTRRNDNDAVRRIVARLRVRDRPGRSQFVIEEERLRRRRRSGIYSPKAARSARCSSGCRSSWASACSRSSRCGRRLARAQRHSARRHRLRDCLQRARRVHRPIDRRASDAALRHPGGAVPGFPRRNRGHGAVGLRRVFGRARGDRHRAGRLVPGTGNGRRHCAVGADLSDADPLHRRRRGMAMGRVRPDRRAADRRRAAWRRLERRPHHDRDRLRRHHRGGFRAAVPRLVRKYTSGSRRRRPRTYVVQRASSFVRAAITCSAAPRRFASAPCAVEKSCGEQASPAKNNRSSTGSASVCRQSANPGDA